MIKKSNVRCLAKKIKKNEFLITHIKKVETIEGKEVEIVMGTNTFEKEKLEKIIEAYKIELKTIVETKQQEQIKAEHIITNTQAQVVVTNLIITYSPI